MRLDSVLLTTEKAKLLFGYPICLSILLSICLSLHHLYVLTYYEPYPKPRVQRYLKACSLALLSESLGRSQPS